MSEYGARKSSDELDLEPGADNETKVGYRGKRFTIPKLSATGIRIQADATRNAIRVPSKDEHLVAADLNSIWNTERFLAPRLPISLGVLPPEVLSSFSMQGSPRVLDMPIKFPGSDFRLPQELAQFEGAVRIVADYEAAINPDCFDEYYCYMTVDQGWVKPGSLQREAPCHVDGFQGPRWNPKHRINHSYVVGDKVPTAFFPQPFDFSELDEARHNFFWEMNRVVAQTQASHAWRPADAELCLMDAYCAHRGSEASEETFRTWIRLSFETRKFDRLGNAKNPMFSYDWEMVPRDIEGLHLVAWDPDMDPSLRVFPWQDVDGNALSDPASKTKPKLTGDHS